MEQKTSEPNLRLYDLFRQVPESAKKEITGGNLKGYTNINAQWRLETLTRMFGPVGIGWVIENVKYWTTEGMGESVMWCSLDLRVKVDGEWSLPINGIGGSKLYGKGKGDGINDEACKMAQTDAISVACKDLGIAADVYAGLDDTKYRGDGEQKYDWNPMMPPAPMQTPAPAPQVPDVNAVIEMVKNVKSEAELYDVWNQWKGLYGSNTALKKAIKDCPYNSKTHKK